MRLRESGIVTILLLGLTGCAGVQPRLGWMQPSTAGAEDSEGRPLSRLAFWRRHHSDDELPAGAASDATNPGRSSMIAGNDGEDNDRERSRPRLLRRLPVVSRFFKNEDREESDDLPAPSARYARSLLSPPSVAQAATGTTAAAPSSGEKAPAPVATTASAPSVGDRPEVPPLRELTVDLAGDRPDVDPATVPVRNPAPPQNAPAGPQQPNLPEPSTLPNLGPENVPPPTAAPGPQPNPDSPDLSPATPNRGPSLPSSSTPEPSSKPATESARSPVVSTTGPVWPVSSQESFSGSAQSFVMPSPQGGYVSGGCESTCGPKCKTHKLCPLKKHKRQVTESSVVLPSGQGMVSSCEATAPCKKECFLKKWLHHKSGCKTKGCQGCKSCSYCGEAPAMVSAQGPIVSSQQW